MGISLTMIALGLGLWSATTFIHSSNLAVNALAGVAPLVTLLALPVIAVGVGGRHWIPTGLALIAALVPWGLVVGYVLPGPGPSSVGTGSTLRVMYIDGAHGKANPVDIVNVARSASVDMVVVTGLTSELAHQLTVDGLDGVAPAQWVKVSATGTNGTGIWSRAKMDNLTQVTDLSKPAVQGQIEAGTGKIGITVVQLPGGALKPGRAWGSDLATLRHRPAPAPTSIVVGDLNAGPWQPAFRSLSSAGWRDAADVVGKGLRPTWPSWSPLPIAPVDHVLVNRGLGVSGADATRIGGSTHRALIVSLVIPHAGG
jgi:endonuclease/exonuclease/phosphatase family metal-dependent hydrolase